MADAFISYAREDHDAAARLASIFEAAGWDVWWDREILAGQSFDEVIERELAAAKVVIVLWSEHSVTSPWVRSEATDALERGVLIPAQLSPATLPLVFRRAQTANLVSWEGDADHAGLEDLIASMEARLGPRRRAPSAPVASAPGSAAGEPAARAEAQRAPGESPAPRAPGANGPAHVPPAADTLGTTPPVTASPPAANGKARPANTAPGAAVAGAPAHSSSGDGGTGPAAGTGTGGSGGGGGLLDQLLGNTAARRRTLFAGGAALVVLLAVAIGLSQMGGGEPPLGVVLSADQAAIALAAQSGGEAHASVLLTNEGDESVDGVRVSATGSRFAVDGTACADGLEPGATCELLVMLDATSSAQPETVSERLLIEGGSESLVVSLDGEITGTRAFTVAPESLDLGEVEAGDSGEVVVTNDGDTPLAIDATVDGTAFAAKHDCGTELAAGERCAVTVTVAGRSGVSRTNEASGALVVAVGGLPERRITLSATLAENGGPVVVATALAAAPVADSARITGITVAGGSYVVAFETTGYTPVVPGQHVHFFFDTVPPDQAGRPGGGPWQIYGGRSPYTGYSVGDRPTGANELCILVANEDHSVRANTGNCYPLP